MPLDWSPLVAFVRRHHRFFLTTHERPDGDGLGAMLALGEALERLDKQVRRVIPSPLPPRYEFLDPEHKIEVFTAPSKHDCDALIVLDTGTWNQLADVAGYVRESPADKLVIDHHRTQDDLGATRFVDVTAEATGRLAYDAICALDVSVTATMARDLFTAIVWDTGWFRHPNVTPATFVLAEKLVAAGAVPTAVYEDLYERTSLGRLRLTGRALDRITTVFGGRVAYMEVQFADYAEVGAIPFDTEDLINYPRSLIGVEVAMLFIEQRDGSIKVSFRSKQADVSRIAEQFGGGGHRLAAGAKVPGPIDMARERVLAAVGDAINNQNDD
jgi:bifunctional oligoribonuclease and PAP phosphatase NrnA